MQTNSAVLRHTACGGPVDATNTGVGWTYYYCRKCQRQIVNTETTWAKPTPKPFVSEEVQVAESTWW